MRSLQTVIYSAPIWFLTSVASHFEKEIIWSCCTCDFICITIETRQANSKKPSWLSKLRKNIPNMLHIRHPDTRRRYIRRLTGLHLTLLPKIYLVSLV